MSDSEITITSTAPPPDQDSASVEPQLQQQEPKKLAPEKNVSDSETTITSTAPPPDQDSASVEPQLQQQEPKKLTSSSGISLSIWPPTRRTRDAVITRLIETLSTTSVLSKRYGTVPKDEAEAAARLIEEEAYGVANGTASAEDDGLEILQLYSKEISKRMLETVKSRSGSGSTVDNSVSETPSSGVAPTAASEEISSSVEAEA